MGKVFKAALVKLYNPGSTPRLELPASPYEVLDALDRLRPHEGETSFCEITEYYAFEELETVFRGLQYEDKDVFKMNALAKRLSEMDEEQGAAFAELIKMEKAPVSLARLIDLAYSSDRCQVQEALNDFQLGALCVEQGLIPGANELPSQLYDLLDFQRIGREQRQKEGGVFVERSIDHPGGYVVRHSELMEVSKTLDLTRREPDYAILLNVSKGFFNDPAYDNEKSVPFKLPADSDTLNAVLDTLDIWDWREAGWSCLDCRVPALMDAVSDADDIEFLNRLAQNLAAMGPAQLTAYKALVEATHCQDLLNAEFLAEQLDNYTFSPEIRSPAQVAERACPSHPPKGQLERENYQQELGQKGRSLIEESGAVLTPYGLIQRKDHQPVQTHQQKPPEGGMTLA